MELDLSSLAGSVSVDGTDPLLAALVWVLAELVKKYLGSDVVKNVMPIIAFVASVILRLALNGGHFGAEDLPRALAAAGVASLFHGQVSGTTKMVKKSKPAAKKPSNDGKGA